MNKVTAITNNQIRVRFCSTKKSTKTIVTELERKIRAIFIKTLKFIPLLLTLPKLEAGSPWQTMQDVALYNATAFYCASRYGINL